MQENLGIKINIYLCHAFLDYEIYRIKELAEYLESQPEINRAYFLEENLIGNYDNYIEENIPQSHFIIFLATRKSVFDSKDCLKELKIGFENKIPIVTIKGETVSWEELKSIELGREIGFEFHRDYFDRLLDDLYNHIQKLWETMIPKTKIYLNHSVRDFELFHIKEIADFLEQFKEIHQVIYVERDLIGNVDEFINEMVIDTDFMISFCSASFLQCKDCLHELSLAREFAVETLPIKSTNVSWDDLKKVGLSRELGFNFDEDNFDKLCADVKRFIKKVIQLRVSNKENLEKRRIINNLSLKFKELLKSSKFDEFYLNSKDKIEDFLYCKDTPEDILYNVLAEFTGKTIISKDREPQCKAFMSYATANSDYFKIKPISEGLEKYKDVAEAFYWEGDLNENAIVYMSNYIGKSEILVLFCSKEALESRLVELEWSAAIQLEKAVIPVFVNEKCIPPLISSMYGVKIEDIEDTEQIVDRIHNLISKRMKERKIKDEN